MLQVDYQDEYDTVSNRKVQLATWEEKYKHNYRTV